ncbi:hypothetical protein BaRGS_00039709 [Batillaria attramentaria]|uniref:Uncharacterized protein n=1 Tax=Batillaria attramentaria TaxID=370345 RepID=A0ABD0J2H3_9CAEN
MDCPRNDKSLTKHTDNSGQADSSDWWTQCYILEQKIDQQSLAHTLPTLCPQQVRHTCDHFTRAQSRPLSSRIAPPNATTATPPTPLQRFPR